MKNLKIKIWAFALTGLILFIPTLSYAQKYITIGTLDIKALQGDQKTLGERIEEDFQPGKKKLIQIQIANFEPDTKELEIYATDTETADQTTFIAKKQLDESPDLKPWIKLPTKFLQLQSGETKILTVEFNVPQNAGIGLHTGAIMVKEIKKDSIINVEKGIRIYATIEGEAKPASQLQLRGVSQLGESITTKFQVSNLGNTDLHSSLNLQMKDLWGKNINNSTTKIYLQPSETQTIELAIPKPSSGYSSLHFSSNINNNNQETQLFSTFYLPTGPFIFILLIAGIFSLIPSKNRRFQYKNLQISFADFKIFFQKQKTHFKKVSIFGLIVSLSILVSLEFNHLGLLNLLKTNVLQVKPLSNYLVVIKWGNTKNAPLPSTYTKNWSGKIKFSNSQISIQQKLNLEANDSVSVNTENNAINYEIQTGPDNDGIVVQVESLNNKLPLLTYENTENQHVVNVPITDFLNHPIQITEGLHTVQIIAAPGPEKTLNAKPSTPTNEFSATLDAETTPEIGTVFDGLDGLRSIFNDLPATPEVLAKYIMDSEYVKEKNTENALSQIKTDPELIAALEATPDIIQEIAATPNLNFIFIPSEKVNFPNQQFSFESGKIATQELGTIIFVQNKKTAWNSYVTVSDLTSLSGRNRIPASNITVDPGEVILLSGNSIDENSPSTIVPGTINKLTNDSAKSLLVNVTNPDEQAIFLMRPKITIVIPAGTRPGKYQAQLNISSL